MKIRSLLEVFNIETSERQVIFQAPFHFEAPNWTNDGKWIVFNSNGSIYKLPSIGGKPELIDTGFANRCNNDHVLSPDNREIAVSHHDETGISKIYILPFEGGHPRLITGKGPSYLHGWSPDGKI
jgi:Tol biopolymer transport system component